MAEGENTKAQGDNQSPAPPSLAEEISKVAEPLSTDAKAGAAASPSSGDKESGKPSDKTANKEAGQEASKEPSKQASKDSGEKKDAASKEVGDAAKTATAKSPPPPAAEPAEKPSALKEAIAVKKALLAEKVKNVLGVLKQIQPKAVLADIQKLPEYLLLIPKILLHSSFYTKFLAMGFLVSMYVLTLSLVRVYKVFFPEVKISRHTASKVDQSISTYFKDLQDYKEAKERQISFESFTSSIQSEKGNITVFEIEFYIECDTPQTASYIESHKMEFREVIADALQDQVFEVLTTENGKELLKAKMARMMNEKLEREKRSGSVTRVYFTRFVMG